jgi:hypothetical protein
VTKVVRAGRGHGRRRHRGALAERRDPGAHRPDGPAGSPRRGARVAASLCVVHPTCSTLTWLGRRVRVQVGPTSGHLGSPVDFARDVADDRDAREASPAALYDGGRPARSP